MSFLNRNMSYKMQTKLIQLQAMCFLLTDLYSIYLMIEKNSVLGYLKYILFKCSY